MVSWSRLLLGFMAIGSTAGFLAPVAPVRQVSTDSNDPESISPRGTFEPPCGASYVDRVLPL